MNAIIQIESRQVGDSATQTVNARDLHAFLEVRSEFRHWIKNRIEDFGFVEGADFLTLVEIYRGGERKDYHLTLDMAKELAMVERNEKGKQARQYFIDCERRAKEVPAGPALPDFTDPAAAAIAWAEQFRAKQALAIANAAQAQALSIAAPKAEALDLISAAEDAVTITQAAKMLGIKREQLTTWLHANGWVYRQNGTWVAYQQHIQNGRLQFKEARYTDLKTGHECHNPYCHIMPKGLAILARNFAAKQATEGVFA